MSKKKTIVDLNGKSKKVLTGLAKGATVIYKGKKHKFIGYMDYGFSCILKPTKGKQFLTWATEISK